MPVTNGIIQIRRLMFLQLEARIVITGITQAGLIQILSSEGLKALQMAAGDKVR